MIILGGLYFEFQSPGIGFPLVASMIALVLYLTPYYLNGLAANWEIVVLVMGMILLAAEIFIIPGFGVAGFSGVTLIFISLILIMINNDYFNFDFVPSSQLIQSTLAVVAGLCGFLLLVFTGSPMLAQSKAMHHIVNTDTQSSAVGYSVNATASIMIHKTGVAHTILRPSGKVMIDNQLFDAITRGDFIERGEHIKVIGTEGVALQVKKSV